MIDTTIGLPEKLLCMWGYTHSMKSIADLKARRIMDRANEGEPVKAPDHDGPNFERLSKEDDLD